MREGGGRKGKHDAFPEPDCTTCKPSEFRDSKMLFASTSVNASSNNGTLGTNPSWHLPK